MGKYDSIMGKPTQPAEVVEIMEKEFPLVTALYLATAKAYMENIGARRIHCGKSYGIP